jgi:acetyl-CoA carboxylase biotin carboxylase subunit
LFSKILIANRGEIALRIIRACKEMGIATVAVYSEADASAFHVSLADESICIGPSKAKDSYLNMGAVLSAAIACKAQAIHPGYGLLSENAKFAKLCNDCGITFIGPPSEVISRMGDKDEAKRTMKAAGVPVIPGSADVVNDIKEGLEEAEKIGYPVLIKARSGGGGRGIRRIDCPEDFNKVFEAAQIEAKNSFGDSALYVEKFLSPVKHVEVQVLCDNYDNVIILGERDCSIQRKNQKLIEESPCFTLSESIRQKLYETTVKAARATGYRGAGTIEYLLDREGNFYFMEMNTRLQVEHTVSEMVTGVDIVKWQIRVAGGKAFDFVQSEVMPKGHAIECRINAETEDGKPSCGKITLLHVPGGPWVRFDTALYHGYNIPPYYDSMIGKLIVYAKTREEAIRKMNAALCELVIEGVEINREQQIKILSSAEFENGTYTTDFLQKLYKSK